MKSELKEFMCEDRSSVSERLRASLTEIIRRQERRYLGEGEVTAVLLTLEDVRCLRDALLSAEVHASTGPTAQQLLSWAARLVRSVCPPCHDEIGEPVRDVAFEMQAAALPSPPTPAAPLTQEQE